MITIKRLFRLSVLILSIGMSFPQPLAEHERCELPLVGKSIIVTDGPYEGTHGTLTRTSAEALDLVVDEGTPVYPCKPGKVITSKLGWIGWGNYVEIQHSDGTISRYAHLGSVSVDEGDEVDYTTKIGRVDSTGKSTNHHLHFDVQDNDGNPVSIRYLVDWNEGCPASRNNDTCSGYAGKATGRDLPDRPKTQSDENASCGGSNIEGNAAVQSTNNGIRITFMGFRAFEEVEFRMSSPCGDREVLTTGCSNWPDGHTDCGPLRTLEDGSFSYLQDYEHFVFTCPGFYEFSVTGLTSNHRSYIRICGDVNN